MKVAVNCMLYAGTTGYAELPEGRTWEDVEHWFVKWDSLFLSFRDGTDTEIELNSNTEDVIDWKRPSSVEIYGTDEEGQTDYDRYLDGDNN